MSGSARHVHTSCTHNSSWWVYSNTKVRMFTQTLLFEWQIMAFCAVIAPGHIAFASRLITQHSSKLINTDVCAKMPAILAYVHLINEGFAASKYVGEAAKTQPEEEENSYRHTLWSDWQECRTYRKRYGYFTVSLSIFIKAASFQPLFYPNQYVILAQTVLSKIVIFATERAGFFKKICLVAF